MGTQTLMSTCMCLKLPNLGVVSRFIMSRLMGVSAQSLHIESTNSTRCHLMKAESRNVHFIILLARLLYSTSVYLPQGVSVFPDVTYSAIIMLVSALPYL